jgi:hypothetical protein
LLGSHFPIPFKVQEPVHRRLKLVDSALQPAQQEEEEDNSD